MNEGESPAARPIGLAVGAVVQGRYRVCAKIGEGGMGSVYEVEHILVGRRLALKTLRPSAATDAEVVARFRREARAAAAIGDPHIVEVTDMGMLDDGSPFLVMELLRGPSLADVLQREGVLSVDRAIGLALQCCRALGAAHARGIVHRDLKPANLVIVKGETSPEFVKIVDFGISKFREPSDALDASVTRTGAAIGTPLYMSPEQLRGVSDIDSRTDVWAMGVLVYEMLTGHLPFQGTTFADLAVEVLTQAPPAPSTFRPDLPPGLDAIVARALAKDRDERFADLEAMAAALAPLSSTPISGSRTRVDAPRPAHLSALEIASTIPATPMPSYPSPSQAAPVVVPRGSMRLAVVLGALAIGFAGALAIVLWAQPRQSPGAIDAGHVVPRLTTNAWAIPSETADASEGVLDPRSPMSDATADATQPSAVATSIAGDASVEAIDASSPRVEQPRVVRRGTPTTAPPTPPTTSVPPPAPTEPRTRRVVVHNGREVGVTITLRCGAVTLSRTIAPSGRETLSAPDVSCRVACRAAGVLPLCPPTLPAGASSLVVR